MASGICGTGVPPVTLGGAEAVARLPLDIRLALHWFETDPQPKR